MRRDPGGLNMGRLQTLRHREPTGRFAPETGASTARDRQQPRGETRFRKRRETIRGGSGLQAVHAGQLPPEALQDFQELLAVGWVDDVARQRAPAERVRGVLALRQPGPVRAGQPAAERRRPGLPGLGCASDPETAQDVQPLHQPRAAHHPQLLREDHKNRVKGNVAPPPADASDRSVITCLWCHHTIPS